MAIQSLTSMPAPIITSINNGPQEIALYQSSSADVLPSDAQLTSAAGNSGLQAVKFAARSSGTVSINVSNASTQAQMIAQSNDPASTTAMLESNTTSSGNDIATQYNQWYQTLPFKDLPQEYIDQQNATKSTAIAVLERAQDSGGLNDPQAFVKSLNTQDLAALQTLHDLADPINPVKLTVEGAYNLLVLPNKAKDLNHDGVTTTGAADSISFPPQDAPQAVLDAWNTATKDMDQGAKLTMELSMWLNANGGPDVKTGSIFPCYANNFDWKSFVSNMVKYTQNSMKYQTTPEQKAITAEMVKGYEEFLKNLV
jgi:hypothetical protein